MSKFVIALVVCGLLAAANALPKVQRKIHPHRIVGGEDAKQGELPYQISLRVYGSHYCGGSLVIVNNKQVVTTAAHCVQGSSDFSVYTVIAGDLNQYDDSGLEQTRQVTNIISHQNYSGWTYINDIAIVFIASEFNLNDNVQPIPLPDREQQTPGQIVVSGWGDIIEGGGFSPPILQYVQIPVVPDAACRQAYDEESIVDSMLCAGLLGEGGKDSCQGDSGGPLRAVDGGYLAGVVSWGYGCADARYPGVNTEVSYFVDWLNSNVN